MPRKISTGLQLQVRLRARYLCEYCHANERWQCIPFTIDHTVPDGPDTLANLALACFFCNRRKSDRQTAFDSLTDASVPLFNPRRSPWSEHFIWSNDALRIIPLTAVGRATAELLQFNRPRLQDIRAADVVVARHPPEGDPVQTDD